MEDIQLGLANEFMAYFADAMSVADGTWSATQTGYERRSSSGNIARIQFLDTPVSWQERATTVTVDAGLVCDIVSGHLWRLGNGGRVTAGVNGHVMLHYKDTIARYGEWPVDPDPRFVTGTKADPAIVHLSSESAALWLGKLVSELVPKLEGLDSNRALYDWLISADGYRSALELRHAALLGYHIGIAESELRALLDRAEDAHRDHRQRMEAKGVKVKVVEQRTRRIQDWSHDTFVEYLRELSLAP